MPYVILDISGTDAIQFPVGNTAQRPNIPNEGMIRYNNELQLNEYYDGIQWQEVGKSSISIPVTNTFIVSGYTLGVDYELIYVDSNNNVVGSPVLDGSTIYRFYTTTTTTLTGNVSPNFTGNVEYLVVGGGGGGGSGVSGSYYGGGGGAGGYRTNYQGGGSPNILVSASNVYTVTVGKEGIYTNSSGVAGTNGDNSVFSTISSSGGGGGAASTLAGSGGSGGGASFILNTAGSGNLGGYTPVEGYRGGNYNIGGQGGPGGGASGQGSDLSTTPTLGLSNTITGTAIIYGYGGGGNPSSTQYTTAGSGGKGGRNVGGEQGSNGYSGTVILRIPSFNYIQINTDIDMSCNAILDLSFITFCDGTYIGPGSSFDISTNQVLKIIGNSGINMVINEKGDIGIGTQDPSALLHLYDNVFTNTAIPLRIETTNTANLCGVQFKDPSTIGPPSAIGCSGTDLIFNSGTNTTFISSVRDISFTNFNSQQLPAILNNFQL
jgi:hypothetical protein